MKYNMEDSWLSISSGWHSVQGHTPAHGNLTKCGLWWILNVC